MGANNYIVVIEIGSSKITGVIGYKAYDGVHVVARASEKVKGFISKGVVRNVDEAGKCINNIINLLDAKIDDGIQIEKAYVAYGGLSVHSRRSTIVKEFTDYTKITQDIFDEIILENDETFKVPEGYQKVQVLPLEYRHNGNDDVSPIGVLTKRIECNFLNILIKEQFLNQLNESFKIAKIAIADSFNGAYIEAQEVLTDEEKRCGAAVVNIGAQTTTVSVFSNNLLRHHVVLPIGGDNITRDLQSEKIVYDEAEMLKITRGYAPTVKDDSSIPVETSNSIIEARMIEIIENAMHQIKLSGELVSNVVFTGGGSKLSNIEKLIDENVSNYRVRIDTAPQINVISAANIAPDDVGYTLCALLKLGKENCCSEPEIVVPSDNTLQPDLFSNETVVAEPKQRERWSLFGTRKTRSDEELKKKEEEKRKKEEEKRKKEEEKRKKSSEENGSNSNIVGGIYDFFGKLVDNVTEEESDGDIDDEN